MTAGTGSSTPTSTGTMARAGQDGPAAAAEPGPAAGLATPLVRPYGLDHVNLHVRDAEAALRFHTEVLGLAVRDVLRRNDAGRATFVELAAGQQTVFLMEQRDYRPPAERNARGLNHLCLLVDSSDPQQLQADLRARGVTIRGTREGRNQAGQRTFSIYVEDLDGHGIELEQVVGRGSAS